MAKSGQYMPHKSQPLHFSAAITCGGWYPRELKAEERASTLVGQNSTQKPHALQRSTMILTAPLAMPSLTNDYGICTSHQGVMPVTFEREAKHRRAGVRTRSGCTKGWRAR